MIKLGKEFVSKKGNRVCYIYSGKKRIGIQFIATGERSFFDRNAVNRKNAYNDAMIQYHSRMLKYRTCPRCGGRLKWSYHYHTLSDGTKSRYSSYRCIQCGLGNEFEQYKWNKRGWDTASSAW